MIRNYSDLVKLLGDEMKRYFLEYFMIMVAKVEKYDEIKNNIDNLTLQEIKEIIK